MDDNDAVPEVEEVPEHSDNIQVLAEEEVIPEADVGEVPLPPSSD